LVEKTHLVVGIDPGTTTGVALVGLEGKVLRVSSSRTWSLKDLIHMVIEQGYPLIVATDVSPVPAFVDKVCHLFEAVLYEPPHSLSVEEKWHLSRSADLPAEFRFKNSHERDALAAAVKALESYSDKFRWIDKKLDERGLSNISEMIKTMVVSGSSLSDSLEQVLSERKKREKTRGKHAKEPERKGGRKRTRSRRIETSMINNMEREILELKGKLKERELKIRSLGMELEKTQSNGFWDIVRSKEVDSRNKMIVELKRSLSRVAADRDRLRKKVGSSPGSGVSSIAEDIEIIDVLKDLTKKTVRDLLNRPGDTSRVIMARDCSGTGSTIAGVLRDARIEGVLYDGGIPAPAKEGLESCGIAPVPLGKIDILDLGRVAVAIKKPLDRALDRERKRMAREVRRGATYSFERYVEDYRKRLT